VWTVRDENWLKGGVTSSRWDRLKVNGEHRRGGARDEHTETTKGCGHERTAVECASGVDLKRAARDASTVAVHASAQQPAIFFVTRLGPRYHHLNRLRAARAPEQRRGYLSKPYQAKPARAYLKTCHRSTPTVGARGDPAAGGGWQFNPRINFSKNEATPWR